MYLAYPVSNFKHTMLNFSTLYNTFAYICISCNRMDNSGEYYCCV